MNEHADDTQKSADGLWRWLLGGLAGGAIILGLLIAAYAIGYHRGQHHPHTAAATSSAPTPTTTTATTTTTPSPAVGPVAVTPALVAQGKSLSSSDGCSACHSLTGSAGVGPSWKGLYESHVTLTNGRTVIANAAYLTKHIIAPNAITVKGFPTGVMATAIASFDLSGKPKDVAAIVAFIKSLAH